MTVACMGGHCLKRNYCANYHAADRREPAERLCVPGADGIGRDLPVFIHTQSQTLEKQEQENA